MVLPLVRELFADVELMPAFARAASLVKSGAERISVSGLTPTAKALVIALLARSASRPLIVVVSDNRAAEELVPLVQGFAELTGAVSPAQVLDVPAYDVLPFEGLSPHPEIQEKRASALWKIATGGAHVVIAPAASAAMRLRGREYYAELARTLRRGESVDLEALTAHLNTA